MDFKTVEPFIPFIISISGIWLITYALIRFLVLPLIKYRRIKKHIVTGMIGYLESVTPVNPEQEKDEDNFSSKTQWCRKLSSELERFYNMEIPFWYRSLLQARGEFPTDAAVHLKGLSLASDYDHAWCRIKRVARALRI